MSTQPTFGARVRSLRDAAGLTAQSLADAIGRERAYVSGIERGHERPPAKEVCDQLAAALNVDPGPLWALAVWERVGAEEREAFRQLVEAAQAGGTAATGARATSDQQDLRFVVGQIAALRPDLPLASALRGALLKVAEPSLLREDLLAEPAPPEIRGRGRGASTAWGADPLTALCGALEAVGELPEPAAAELVIAFNAMACAVLRAVAPAGVGDARTRKSRRKSRE